MVAYTNINIGLLCAALVARRWWALPILFANSAAILTSFQAGFLLDPSARERIREWGGWTHYELVAYDLAGHVLPFLFAGYMVARMRAYNHVQFWSLAMHAVWLAFHQDWSAPLGDLSHIYVSMDPWHWRATWVVAAITHVAALPVLQTWMDIQAWCTALLCLA